VKTADAASKVSISYNGQNVITSTVPNGNSKQLMLQFMPLNELDQETPVTITVSKGIPLALMSKSSQKDTIIKAIIPSRYNLSVTGMTAQHSGTEGTVIVNTSQPVNEEGLKAKLSLSPNISFEVSATDEGFVITSTSFKADQSYELTIAQTVKGIFGGRLKQEHNGQIVFGKLDPSIAFTNNDGIYLSTQGLKNVGINIVSVPKVQLTIVKVYENNLEQLIRSGKRYGYLYSEDEDDDGSGSFEYYDTEHLGDTVFTRIYETSKLPKKNAMSILHMDFTDKLKSYDGVYIVTVASRDHRWVQSSKIISISDIGLIVKEEEDNIYVFANSIRNATAIADAKISFVSTNNQKIYTATTNNSGVASFTDIEKQRPGFKVGMITAKVGDEFTFVWLNQSRVETSRFDVGGRVPNRAGLNAMLYAERNLYRPGEVMHVSAIVRNESWENPGEMPVKLRLVMPNGKEFAMARKILNEEGSCETAFNLPFTALTGTYTLELFTGNDVLLNSYGISVEDFVPDRIKAQLKINKTEYRPGDTVHVNLQADNLFGTPAANRSYECQLNIGKEEFRAKNFPDYTFSIENDFNFSTEVTEGKTDDKGRAFANFPLRKEMRDVGMLYGNITSGVFDETGRPVHRFEHFTVYTQDRFLGIKEFDDYVSTKAPLKLSLVAVDKDGAAQNNVAANILLIKKEWHTVIQQDGSRYKYVSQREEKIIKQQALRISGNNSSFYFTPELSGEYEVRLSLQGSNSYVSRSFYAWGWGNTQYNSFDVNNEGNVTIKPDKEKYKVGENIDLLFTTPFEGRMLVTIERNHIFEHVYLNTQNKSCSYSLKATDVLVPNVYVTATLIRPMDGTEMPLTVAHGFRSVTVENPSNHLPVTVTMAEKARSKTKQTIIVKTTPGAYVTVAAVDEGILQVKNYTTPDAYKYFYQKVALSTNSYDIYPLLLPEIKIGRMSTGGDGSEQSGMRVNPMFVNRIKNVSYWSGIIQADNKGVARYTIDVPQFSGDIRAMAVAYKGKAFGGADQHMKIADPVIISAGLPRFLSPKDEVVMPVTLSNTTAKEATATATVIVSGPLSCTSPPTQTVRIPANSENRVVFNITALQSIGAGKVIVSVKAGNETFTNETDISIRPTASLQKIYLSGQVTQSSPVSFAAQNNFIPSSARAKVIVSSSPLVQFSKNISELVQYPYGCVEQTTSAAFPQLYYRDLVKVIYGKDVPDLNPGYNVQQAILKLQSMQLSNGALSYWPNGGGESWWGSIYACHFLVEARKAGYEVNKNTVDRLLEYIKYKLNSKSTEIYYYNENLKKEIASKEIAYSLYVLAVAGQPQQSVMNYYKAHPQMLSLDSKYMLAAAYALAGQRSQSMQVLPASFTGEVATQALGGSFYSYIRDEALALNALIDIDFNNPQVGTLARTLSEQVRKERYLNTQENSFSILAFGKIARAAAKTNSVPALFADGKQIASGKDLTVNLTPFLQKKVELRVTGNGAQYYFYQLSGISSDGKITEEDKFLKARRSFYNRDGALLSEKSFRQNDLIIVKLTLESSYGAVDNIVLTDMLPAGLEIENARLSDLPEIKWIKNSSEPDYLDIRDDRINFFTSIDDEPKTFYYMVRAVSPGIFQLGPVQADAMYNGAYHSYNGAGLVKISER
jgi:alpha-2-macroglobulin